MSSQVRTCPCGTPHAPSVSISADDNAVWRAVMECPVCGFLAFGAADEPLATFADAVCRWNALASDPKIHVFRRRWHSQ